jgi:hypothetical protein
MDRSYIDRNAASLERLRRTVADSDDSLLSREVEPGWTVGVLLAHQAFWDRFVTIRWQAAVASGTPTPADVPAGLTDLLNDAMTPLWRAISNLTVGSLAVAAAEEVDQVAASLPDASVEAVVAEGRERLIDRSHHRSTHLDAIEGPSADESKAAGSSTQSR